jgi:hypothetical protein
VSKYLDKIEEALARKSENFWAKMRTNLSLMHRSDNVDELSIDLFKAELTDILDSGVLNYPDTLLSHGIEPDMSLRDRKHQLGLNILPREHRDDEQRFLRDMAYKADSMRKSNWSWRIGQEAVEKNMRDWHPFFVTLTIDPLKCDDVEREIRIDGNRVVLPAYSEPSELWKKGREFRKYIRRLANVVCKELGHQPCHKPPYRPESDYVTYAGVIEHGKSREHHHGHFVIWLRAVPSCWRICPNKGRRTEASTRNECLPMRDLWPWSLPGLSPALYFRSVGDIWERKYNFVLPLIDGKPMKVSLPRAAGMYITKYLSKEHKEWHHRMKATRNLGMITIRKKIKTMSLDQLEALSWRPKTSRLNLSLMRTHTCPLGLVRYLAKRQIYLIQFRQNRLDLNNLLTTNTQTFTKMLSSVRSGARPDRMSSLQFFDWVGQFLPVEKGYCEKRIIEAHSELVKLFPPEKIRVQHVKLGANDIGHTSGF